MSVLKQIEALASAYFSFENQFTRSQVLAFLPIQANASSNESDGVRKDWFQLIAQYKSSYSAIDSDGNPVETDNNTIKILKVKFSPKSTVGVSPTQFKKFFDTYFVGKKFLILPVGSELPVIVNKVQVKDQTQTVVDSSFSLSDFIKEVEKASKSESK